jgi:hypothetical protein
MGLTFSAPTFKIVTHNPEVLGSNPSPATEYNRRPPGYLKKASPAVFGSWTWQKQEKKHEPQTTGLDHF